MLLRAAKQSANGVCQEFVSAESQGRCQYRARFAGTGVELQGFVYHSMEVITNDSVASPFGSVPTAAPLERIEHLLPENASLEAVDLSIVIPAMNEEITVGEFMEWCKEGIERAGVSAQILIVDSSTDNTPKIVLEHGGEVLRVPKRGVGSAYLDSIPYIRGKWILMGDADLTYDFREIAPFVEEFRKGAEFIMGSRFRGSIEKGAMPKLHQYFGTPLTNWILNRIYRSNFSDIHCGIRGVTREALDKINITSRGWEYASEMVLKAARLNLVSSEVPIKFYKDRAGRFSHHRRVGWRSPWIAGWVNLKVMLVYAADSFLLNPGIALMAIGLVLSLGLAAGPVRIGKIGFSLYWMLLGVTCTTLGYSSIQIGILVRVMHGLRPRFVERVQRIFTYDRGMIASAGLTVAGLVLLCNLTYHYLKHGLQLEVISHPAILGLLLVILGFQTFCFTLLMEMAKRVIPTSRQ
jgi:glycosyltransferase involved in cell wall biosynthesis